MAATINTNIASINAQRNLGLSGASLATTMQRLSSGLRVNSAKDDAAGLAIAERMNTQVKGLTVAARNANDGISLAQTAEGALGKVGDMLQRMRELAVQAGNATNSRGDREALQAEVRQLTDEIDRVARQTHFNGQKVLDGSFTGAVFQVGANAGDNITLGALADTRAEQVASVTYGTTTRTQNASVVTDYSQPIAAGALQINAKNGLVSLREIPPASSGLERLGQVVEAINSKTADTGITAYLTKHAGSDEVKIDFMSDGVAEDGIRYRSVEFFGFTPETTGVAPTNDVDPYLPNTALNAALQAAQAATGQWGDGLADRQLFLDVATALTSATFPAPHDANMDTSVNPLSQALQDYIAAVNAAVESSVGGDRLNLQRARAALDEFTNTYRVAVLDSNIKEETGMGIGSNSGAAGEHGIDTIDVTTQKGAWIALKKVDSAIDQVNGARAALGALQSRFENAVGNIDIQVENLAASRGRIVDADFAKETANLARTQILQQAGMAMVAQANQLPQNVLQLLQG